MRLSIRWRLTLWNTLALTIVLLGFAGMVFGLLRHALYEQLDHHLLAAWQQLEKDHRLEADAEGRLRYWAEEFYEHNAIFTVAYRQDGERLVRTQELAETSVPPAPAHAGASPALTDMGVPVVGRQRVLNAVLSRGSNEYRILLMTSLTEVDHELAELSAALTIAVPVALGCAAAAGYLLARKALAPVEQLRRQTRQITAEKLDQRLPVGNPDDELGRLAATINEMIGRLERSFAEVRRFTADASHELRTPLTAVRAEIEAALRREALPDHVERLLGSVLEECQRLTRLTDQLLTLCREDAGDRRSATEPLDLAALVRDVGEIMRPLAEEKGLELRSAGASSCPIEGDPARLRQVVYSVIDNAIKYTPAPGRVDLLVEPREESAVITVRDTGVGIPAEQLPRVFDRFYRVDKARTREQGGTGLGLSIARSIVQAHGGTITLASTPGHGTVCTIVLPQHYETAAIPGMEGEL